MYSNRASLSKRPFQPVFDFLQKYTYSRCIHEANGSCYLANFIIQQPDIFNIREVESEEGNFSARNNLNDLEDENFTDQQDNAQIEKKHNHEKVEKDKQTEDSLKQTAYFSECDSQLNFQNFNNINVVKEEQQEREEQHQSLKSKLLMKLIKQKSRKKSELGKMDNGKMEQKMEEDISYLKKLRKHCKLR